MLKNVALILLPLLLLGAPEHAQAQDPAPSADEERARLIYDNGVQLYEEGLYDKAIVAFREALKLSGRQSLLYNIANAYERMGDPASALDALNEYRIYAKPEEKETLDRRIRALERRVDEKRAADAAAAAAAAAQAAPVTPTVVEPVAPVLPPAPTTKPNPARPALLVTGAAVTAGAGIAAALSYGNSREHIANHDKDAYADARLVNNMSLGLVGVGVGVAVIGLVLPATVQVGATTLSPAILPGGAGFGVRRQF